MKIGILMHRLLVNILQNRTRYLSGGILLPTISFALYAETGYSSSAISERIYAVPDTDGKWKGAILLYVTEGGMDGTLGGLTSLYTHFQTFLDRVLDEAQVCSMDPLCEESPNRMLSDVGCYACAFNPETSCEHRNMFLDRLLLLECAEN